MNTQMKVFSLFLLVSLVTTRMNGQANLVVDLISGPPSGVPNGTDYAVGPNQLIFTPISQTIGVELWASDGTEEGTVLIKDIWPGSSQSFPAYLTFLNGTAFFVAEDAEHGTELWKTDGTPNGTVLVKDIIPGPESGAEVFFSVREIHASPHLGYVFFSATNGSSGDELWRSDGTSEGTQMVKELVPGFVGASPNYFTELNGIVYFTAAGGTFPDDELYRTDGTSVGTYLVKDVWPGPISSDIRDLTLAGDKIFFSARTQTNGYELWVTDGTTDGTRLVKDILVGEDGALDPGFLNVPALMPLGDQLVFIAVNAQEQTSIWVSDGTENGTQMLYEFSGEGFFQGTILDWAVLNGKLYFLLNSLSDEEGLWVTDGTIAGTKKSAEFNFFTNPVDAQITSFNNQLIISADHNVGGDATYRTDGTDEGTTRIAQANQAIFFGATDDGKLFFSAENSQGRELWVYHADSTSAVQLISALDLNVFPNPVTSTLTIQGPDENSIEKVVVRDVQGRTLQEWDHTNSSYPVDLPAGYYQLLLRSNRQWYVHPLIIAEPR